MTTDLKAEVERWLEECGSCDAALPMACTCPPGDYRSILLKLWVAYESKATNACPHAWEEINPGHWVCKELCGTPDVDLTRSPDWLATKALVETATRLGVELGKAEGRKQAGEEIAVAIEGVIDGYLDPRDDINGDRAAAIAREIGSRPQEGDKS